MRAIDMWKGENSAWKEGVPLKEFFLQEAQSVVFL